MAFIVEDGTVVANANAYITVAFADTYHDDRAQTAWAAADSEKDKEAAIIRATDHIDRLYGTWFRGFRQQLEQALEWPRHNAVDNDGFSLDNAIPPQLLKATAEYAVRALLIGVLTPDVPPPVPAQSLVEGATGTEQGGVGTVTRTKDVLGPLEESRNYSDPDPLNSGLVGDGLMPRYPAADLYLKELLIGRNSTLMVRGS